MPRGYLEYEFLFGVGAHKIFCPENNSFERLKHFYKQNKDWMFGYFSYDLKNETGSLSSKNLDNLEFPNLYFLFQRLFLQ